MGYCGLSSVWDSDMASDLAHTAIEAQVKVLKRGLKLQENEWNTGGPENVGLFFEQFIIPTYKGVICDELYELANKTYTALDKLVKETEKQKAWCKVDNNMHLNAYRRLRRKLKKMD